MPTAQSRSKQSLALVALLLLLGAGLRLNLLDQMKNMLSYDEAYDAVDALSLLHSPRIVAFFPANNGRESGWMYYQAAWLALAGVRPFTLRMAAVMVGVLTLAATYAAGRRVVKQEAATWAVGVLAVLYWHVHLSQIALRAILFPLTGSLAVAFFLCAHRSNRLRWWLLGGLFLGLTIYTYFASIMWIAYLGFLLIWWFARMPEQRRGILAALGLTALLAVPMILYLLTDFGVVVSRPEGVAVLTGSGLLTNLLAWINAWFGQGSLTTQLNFPGRPLLDIPLGVLVLLGLASFVLDRKSGRAALGTISLAFLSMLPSLISDYPPHPLRALGLVVPLAWVAGGGASLLINQIRVRFRLAALVPLALIVWSGFTTAQTMRQWLRLPDTYVQMEVHINEATAFVAANLPNTEPVYYSPFSPTHPDIGFNERRLEPRQVGAFDAHSCTVLADTQTAYVSLDMYDPFFQNRLAQWATVQVAHDDRVSPPHYRVYQATPHTDVVGPWDPSNSATVNNIIQLRALNTLPDTITAGDTIHVDLAFRALRPVNTPYSVFLHLYGHPTPYEGGKLWGQADSWICATYPTVYWKPNEVVVQPLDLTPAADAPGGSYTIAVGIYDSASLDRLPLSSPTQKDNYYPLHTVALSGP